MCEKKRSIRSSVSRSRVGDNCVEAIVVVSGILHVAHRTVSLDQRVFAVNSISITALVLGLVVTRMSVSHGLREIIFGMSLYTNTTLLRLAARNICTKEKRMHILTYSSA